jgi:mannose-6-phosphate isomerase-like protein (cupin superfamily)
LTIVMNITKWDKADKYAAQTDIVKQALATPEHSLNELLALMRRTGQAAVYLCGSRLDNDYCFGSEDVGMLLSVLPEDARKAAEPGYHPGSTEVYVTFQGSLVMECLENGRVEERPVDENNALVLPAGQCHRVRYDGQHKAASLIIKTNLRHQPGVVRCDNCTYYRDKTACPVFQSWNAETKPHSPLSRRG